MPNSGTKEKIAGPSPEDLRARETLEGFIRRVNAAMSIVQFMDAVSSVYQNAQTAIDPERNMPAKFRNSRSYHGFAKALKRAEGELQRPASMLVAGCGEGYAGCTSEYAAGVARANLSAIEEMEQLELRPPALENQSESPARTYDLVVTHSLAHFVLDLHSFFRYLCRRVAPGGVLLLGHEPHAAFWNDRGVQQLRDTWRQRRRMYRVRTKYLNPAAYLGKIRRLVRRSSPQTIYAVVNQILKTQYGFRAELTPGEIAGIVDPHLPSGYPFRLGLPGFDPQQLASSYMPGFSLRWLDTSEYPGMDEHEATRLGLPPSVFSAVYRKSDAQ